MPSDRCQATDPINTQGSRVFDQSGKELRFGLRAHGDLCRPQHQGRSQLIRTPNFLGSNVKTPDHPSVQEHDQAKL